MRQGKLFSLFDRHDRGKQMPAVEKQPPFRYIDRMNF